MKGGQSRSFDDATALLGVYDVNERHDKFGRVNGSSGGGACFFAEPTSQMLKFDHQRIGASRGFTTVKNGMVLQGTVLVHGQEHILYDAERRDDHYFLCGEQCMYV